MKLENELLRGQWWLLISKKNDWDKNPFFRRACAYYFTVIIRNIINGYGVHNLSINFIYRLWFVFTTYYAYLDWNSRRRKIRVNRDKWNANTPSSTRNTVTFNVKEFFLSIYTRITSKYSFDNIIPLCVASGNKIAMYYTFIQLVNVDSYKAEFQKISKHVM